MILLLVWSDFCLSPCAQSRSRTRLRVTASIAFLFRGCSKGVPDSIGGSEQGG